MIGTPNPPNPIHSFPSLAARKRTFSHEDLGRAFMRIRGQTTLPDSRVRDLLFEAVRHVESFPGDVVEPVERVVMLTMQRVWADAAPAPRKSTNAAKIAGETGRP